MRLRPNPRRGEWREHSRERHWIEWRVWVWGLLWVLCIKMAANGEQSCYRHIFEIRLQMLDNEQLRALLSNPAK
jgi:hypothetical protein